MKKLLKDVQKSNSGNGKKARPKKKSLKSKVKVDSESIESSKDPITYLALAERELFLQPKYFKEYYERIIVQLNYFKKLSSSPIEEVYSDHKTIAEEADKIQDLKPIKNRVVVKDVDLLGEKIKKNPSLILSKKRVSHNSKDFQKQLLRFVVVATLTDNEYDRKRFLASFLNDDFYYHRYHMGEIYRTITEKDKVEHEKMFECLKGFPLLEMSNFDFEKRFWISVRSFIEYKIPNYIEVFQGEKPSGSMSILRQNARANMKELFFNAREQYPHPLTFKLYV